jgi:hypothetical protein
MRGRENRYFLMRHPLFRNRIIYQYLRNNWALPEGSRRTPPSAPYNVVYDIGGIGPQVEEQRERPSWRNNGYLDRHRWTNP